jgi:hypothetical protein
MPPAEQRTDSTFIDEFLQTWDRFAQGAGDLVRLINRDTERFHEALGRALATNPRWAVGRMVMYLVLQVGGFLPADSALGRSLAAAIGDGGPAPTLVKGQRMYFAGDLYFWWEEHRHEFERVPLYDEWRARNFAQQVAIPMYTAARTASSGGAA